MNYGKPHYFKHNRKWFAKLLREECNGAILTDMCFKLDPHRGACVYIEYEIDGEIRYLRTKILTKYLYSKKHYRVFHHWFWDSYQNVQYMKNKGRIRNEKGMWDVDENQQLY